MAKLEPQTAIDTWDTLAKQYPGLLEPWGSQNYQDAIQALQKDNGDLLRLFTQQKERQFLESITLSTRGKETFESVEQVIHTLRRLADHYRKRMLRDTVMGVPKSIVDEVPTKKSH